MMSAGRAGTAVVGEFLLPTLGLETTAARLAKAHMRGRQAHASLLIGPAHTGKRRLAQWLAQAMLCLDPQSAPPAAIAAPVAWFRSDSIRTF